MESKYGGKAKIRSSDTDSFIVYKKAENVYVYIAKGLQIMNWKLHYLKEQLKK